MTASIGITDALTYPSPLLSPSVPCCHVSTFCYCNACLISPSSLLHFMYIISYLFSICAILTKEIAEIIMMAVLRVDDVINMIMIASNRKRWNRIAIRGGMLIDCIPLNDVLCTRRCIRTHEMLSFNIAFHDKLSNI